MSWRPRPPPQPPASRLLTTVSSYAGLDAPFASGGVLAMGGPPLPPPRQKKLLPVGDAEAGLNARERSLRDDPTKQWQWARWDVETAIKQAASPRPLRT